LRVQLRHKNGLFLGWLAIVILPVASFGGNRAWVWPWAMVLCSLCLIWAVKAKGLREKLRALRLDPSLGFRAAPLCYLGIAWVLSSALYLLPIGEKAGPFTKDYGAALLAFAQACYLVQLFLLTVLVLHSKAKIKRAVLTLFVIAVIHASIATGLHLMEVRVAQQYWVFNPIAASGFFYNKNHFAGYLEMHLGLGIGLLVAGLRLSTDDERTWRQVLRDWLAIIMSAKSQIRIALIVLVIALVVTQSRMGNVAFFSAVIIVGGIAMMIMKRRPKVLPWFLLSLVVIDLLVIGGWFGADRLAERIAGVQLDRSVLQANDAPLANGPVEARERESSATAPGVIVAQSAANAVDLERERPILTRDTLKMWWQAPLLGVGPGGFRSNFPLQRGNQMSALFYDHAHNDVAQLLAERGIVGFSIFISMLSVCAFAALSALASRKSRFLSGLAFGALVSLIAIVIHSFADFNLRISSNAALFTVILALAYLSRFAPDANKVASNASRPAKYTTREKSARRIDAPTPLRSTASTSGLALGIGLLFVAVLLTPTAIRAQQNSQPLTCDLGQAEIGTHFPSLTALRASIDTKKRQINSQAETKEQLRDQLLEITLQAIEAALAWQSIERVDVAKGYWSIVNKELGDTHWRMRQQAKRGSMRAHWLALELQHVEKPIWSAADCSSLAIVTGLQTSGFLYRAAICSQSQNPVLATELMQRSADAGHPAASEIVGRLCYAKQDRACSIKHFCQAVDAGRIQTAGLAAYLITETPPSPALAVKASALFEMAVNQGDFASANNLGELYEQGYIGRPNYQQAELWYKKAADFGIISAQLNLAKLLSRDPRRTIEVEHWLTIAEQTDPELAKHVRIQLNATRQ
jgi:hypothetical protein